jgi:hypothetical protein
MESLILQAIREYATSEQVFKQGTKNLGRQNPATLKASSRMALRQNIHNGYTNQKIKIEFTEKKTKTNILRREPAHWFREHV